MRFPDLPRKCSAIVLAPLSIALFVPETLRSQSPAPADLTFRVGLKSIVIPSPTPELADPGPDYRVLFEPLAPVNNRLVAVFLLPDEMKAAETGTTSLSRYAVVEVLRRAEFAEISPAMYKQVTDAIGNQFGAKLDATMKDSQTEIDLKLKALATQPATITLEQPKMLGSLFSKPDADGYGSLMPISVNGKTITEAVCMSVVRVQNRVLMLYLYTRYEGPDSVKWVQSVGDQWTDAVLKTNSN